MLLHILVWLLFTGEPKFDTEYVTMDTMYIVANNQGMP